LGEDRDSPHFTTLDPHSFFQEKKVMSRHSFFFDSPLPCLSSSFSLLSLYRCVTVSFVHWFTFLPPPSSSSLFFFFLFSFFLPKVDFFASLFPPSILPSFLPPSPSYHPSSFFIFYLPLFPFPLPLPLSSFPKSSNGVRLHHPTLLTKGKAAPISQYFFPIPSFPHVLFFLLLASSSCFFLLRH